MAVNIGPKIGIEGEAEYRKQMNEIIQQAKTLDSEMKNLKSTFDGEAKTIEQNRAQKELLTQQIEVQEKRVAELNKMLEASAEKYGESNSKTLKWKQAVEEANASLNQMQKTLQEMPTDLQMVGKQLEETGNKIQSVSQNVKKVGDGLTKGVTLPIVGVGAASVAAFKEVDEAMDTIVTKTGATGDALEELQNIAKGLATEIPTDFQTAADAVGEVNTRFGVTGEELQELSKQFVQFAELNNTDVSSAVDSVQAAMAALNISTEDAGTFLDTLNKAGQDTGVSVTALADSLATNAASLKEMGYSASDAAMLLANFEKNGVDASSAMTGLKKAYTESLKEGTSLTEMLADLESRLQNSDTQAEAAAEALDLFGSRAGGTLVSAISEGKLSFDELGTAMSDFAGNVSNTYDETLDPLDGLQSSINEMKLLGEDIVTTAAPMITQALGVLSDVVHTLADAWANMDEEQQQNIIKMAAIAAAVGPVVSAVGTLGTGIGSMVGTAGKIMQFLPTIGTALTTVGTALTATVIPAVTAGATAFAAFIVPILPIVAAIGAVVAAGVALYKHWDDVKEAAGIVGDWIGEKWNGIKEKTSEAWANVKEKVSGVMESIGEKTKERLTNMAQAWQENGGGIKGTAAAMWTGITDHFRDSFNAIDKLTGGKLTEIKGKFVGKFKEIATGALDWGKDIIGNIADGITNGTEKVKEAVTNVADTIKEFLHFSEPDRGPLADFNSWMPDMMNQMAAQIEAGRSKVQMAIAGVAGDIATPMATTSTTMNYGGTTIIVNGAPGQDVQELAEIVMDRINMDISQKEAVFA